MHLIRRWNLNVEWIFDTLFFIRHLVKSLGSVCFVKKTKTNSYSPVCLKTCLVSI